jgi:hypothetical protein
VAVEILNVRVAVDGEFVLPKAENLGHYSVVESLRSLEVRDRYIDVIDSDDFGHTRLRRDDVRASLSAAPRGRYCYSEWDRG